MPVKRKNDITKDNYRSLVGKEIYLELPESRVEEDKKYLWKKGINENSLAVHVRIIDTYNQYDNMRSDAPDDVHIDAYFRDQTQASYVFLIVEWDEAKHEQAVRFFGTHLCFECNGGDIKVQSYCLISDALFEDENPLYITQFKDDMSPTDIAFWVSEAVRTSIAARSFFFHKEKEKKEEENWQDTHGNHKDRGLLGYTSILIWPINASFLRGVFFLSFLLGWINPLFLIAPISALLVDLVLEIRQRT